MKSQETLACPRGPGDERFTSLSGSGIGTLRSRIWSNSEKIAALAPIPRPNDRIPIIVTNGFLKRLRTASRRFIYSLTACTIVVLRLAHSNLCDLNDLLFSIRRIEVQQPTV